MALAFMREKATICMSCGTRKEEWDKDRFAYVATAEICPGCEILEQERENTPPKVQGVKIYLIKNDGMVEPNIIYEGPPQTEPPVPEARTLF